MDGQRALLQHKVTLDQNIIDAIEETIKQEVDLALHREGHPVQADGPVATDGLVSRRLQKKKLVGWRL